MQSYTPYSIWLILCIAYYLPEISQAQNIQTDTTLARTYLNKSKGFYDNSKPDSALIYLETAQNIYKTYKNWEQYTNTEIEITKILNNQKKPDSSIVRLENMIADIENKLNKKEKAALANLYLQRGLTYRKNLNKYDLALESYDKALEIRKNVFGEDSDELMKVILDRIQVIIDMEKIEEAISIIQEQLNTAKEDFALAKLNHLLATVYLKQRDTKQALEYLRKALLYHSKEKKEDIANIYEGIGAAFFYQSQLDSTIFYFEKVLAIRKELFGENNPSLARSYTNLGVLNKRMAKHEEAKKYAFLGLKSNLYNFGDKHIYVSNDYYNIARIYDAQAKYDSAVHYFQKALAIRLEVLGEENNQIASTYEALGIVYKKLANYDTAISYHQKALAIREAIFPANSPYLSMSFNNIAGVYQESSFPDKAFPYLLKSIKIQKEQGDKSGLSVSYMNIASLYANLGNSQKALKYLEQSVEISQGLDKNLRYQLSLIYFTLAQHLTTQGESVRAEEYSRQALAIALEFFGENHDHTATVYEGLGQILEDKEEYQEALKYYQKSLDIRKKVFGENHNDIGYSYYGLARVHQHLSSADSTLYFFNKAIDLKTKLLGENSNQVAVVVNNLAMYLSNTGKAEESLAQYQKAIDIFIKNNNIGSLSIANYGVANLYKKEFKKNKTSLEYYQKALVTNFNNFTSSDILKNPYITDNQWILREVASKTLHQKALTLTEYAQQNNDDKYLQAALATYLTLDTLIQKTQSEITSQGDKLTLAKNSKNIYEDVLSTIWEMEQSNTPTPIPPKNLAFYFAERNKANILYANIQENQAKSFAGVPDSLITQEKDLKIERAYYQKMSYKKTDSASQSYLQTKLFESNRAYENLIQGLEQNYPQYYSLKYDNKDIAISTIQANLDKETLLIEYVVAQDKLFIFAISKADFVWKSIALDGAFYEHLKKYNAYIKKFDKAKFAAASHHLYQKLIAPLQAQLKGIQHLMVIPDARLAMIPFGTLSTNTDLQDMEYLLKKYTIAYYPSAKLAFSPKKQRTYEGDFLGLAPVFSKEEKAGYTVEVTKRKAMMGNRKFDPLLASEQELKDILELYRQKNKSARGYFHSKANEGDFKAMRKNYRVTHIATHSEVNTNNPELSAVAFYPEDSLAQEDGILYANEVYALSLESDLLVLSSCETGKGIYAEGEGILSLTRAFMYAGTDNILSSLWQVPDKQTATLMGYFYQNLLKNTPYKEAIRQAKLKMLEDEQSSFPYWWAAFVLMSAE